MTKTSPLEDFQCVQNWKGSLDSRQISKGKNGSPRETWLKRLRLLAQYCEDSGLDPEQLLRERPKDAAERLSRFFMMSVTERKVSHNSAIAYCAYLRGFYVHNDVVFPKRFVLPMRQTSAVHRLDESIPVHDVREDDNSVVLNDVLQGFVSRLELRYQTVALGLLSSGADTQDLLAQDVGFVLDNDKDPRIFWAGDRQKTGTPFRTFISKEATKWLRRYVAIDRGHARDRDPLFVVEGSNDRLKVFNVQQAFRRVSADLGYAQYGKACALRPKRLRRTFRSACSFARIDPGYTMTFMGHSSNISDRYLVQDRATLLLAYKQVEPYVTVFGVDHEALSGVSDEIENLRAEVHGLREEKADLVKRLQDAMLYKSASQRGHGGGMALREEPHTIADLREILTEQEFNELFLEVLRDELLGDIVQNR